MEIWSRLLQNAKGLGAIVGWPSELNHAATLASSRPPSMLAIGLGHRACACGLAAPALAHHSNATALRQTALPSASLGSQSCASPHEACPASHRWATTGRRRQRLDVEREQLPVFAVRTRLLAELRDVQTAVLVGETGSGKTTQVPRLLLEGGLAQGGIIACTQPRRVAAITIAQRVAAEMGTTVGGLVRRPIAFVHFCNSHLCGRHPSIMLLG